LFNRLKSHYRNSYEKFAEDTKYKKWHEFFSTRTGSLVIYWAEIEDETDRRIFELALTKRLNPEFECFS